MLSKIKKGPVIVLLIIFVLGVANYKLTRMRKVTKQHKVESGAWDKLLLILDQIDKNYVDNPEREEITEAAIPLILKRLDPHSIYLPPTELESAEEQLMGNFDGIGIQFNIPNDTAVVINVIAGGPSERAGIMSGDRIVKVDGEVVAGVEMHQDSLVKRLRGKSGSLVEVGVKRIGVKQLIAFDITRDKIPVKSIDIAYLMDNSIGYIKLSKFTRTSYNEFVNALEELKKLGVEHLIFDLRGNSGGYFDQALLICNEFLNKGELIVYTEGRRRARQDFYADGRGRYKELGISVLIDDGSASSSEVVAGAIQDNDRGVIIGRRSFGKGLVQEPIYFSDNSGIRLTVARFYTPTGRSIQKPYGEGEYRDDILERYRHGEMLSADSIRRDENLKYLTPKGKEVYGGGGITPDLFVPIDTVGVTPFFVNVNNMGLTFKFSSQMADRYRGELNKIETLEQLDRFFDKESVTIEFLRYAKEAGLVATTEEWEESGEIILAHIKAFVGRYSPMDDLAFYPILLSIDKVIEVALENL